MISVHVGVRVQLSGLMEIFRPVAMIRVIDLMLGRYLLVKNPADLGKRVFEAKF